MNHLLVLMSCVLTINFTSCAPEYNFEETGAASYYHDVLEGRPTASGTPFSQDSLTAAHKTLPLGTKVLVKNLSNGRQIWVTINDRGPFIEGRIIDLSKRAADSLGILQKGIDTVTIQAFIQEMEEQ